MKPACCPHCQSANAVLGDMTGAEGYAHSFAPRNCRYFRPNAGIAPSGAFYACASCGLVWTAVDPGKLRAFIAAHGEELARQQLDEFDRGPFRDLPDTEIGRKIGAKVAAVDAAARAGKATRKYRELRGVTWDQAFKDTTNWARLTRQEKLELFGWVAKKKAPVDDFDSSFP